MGECDVQYIVQYILLICYAIFVSDKEHQQFDLAFLS